MSAQPYQHATAYRRAYLKAHPEVKVLAPDEMFMHRCGSECTMLDVKYSTGSKGAEKSSSEEVDLLNPEEEVGESLYICAESNIPHWCSSTCPDNLVTLGEATYTCAVSGRAYENVLAAPHRFEKEGNYSRDLSDEGAKREKTAPEQLAQKEMKRAGNVEVKNHRLARKVITKLLFSEERSRLNRRNIEKSATKTNEAVRKYNAEQQRTGKPLDVHYIFEVMRYYYDALRMLNPVDNPLNEENKALMAELIHRSLHTWKLINDLDAKRVRENKYRFDAHVRAIMWQSVSGLWYSDDQTKWIISPLPQLAGMLPARTDLPNLGFVNKPQSRGESVMNNILGELHRLPPKARVSKRPLPNGGEPVKLVAKRRLPA